MKKGSPEYKADATRRMRAWSLLHQPEVAEWKQEHKRKRRALRDRLKSGPCVDCGVNYPPYVMDWDHRDPTTKLFNVGENVLMREDRVLAEIAQV